MRAYLDRSSRILLLMTLLWVLEAAQAAAFLEGDLPRRAAFGARLDDGGRVTAIADDTLVSAGHRVGDVVRTIGGREPGNVLDDDRLLRALPAGRTLTLGIQREGRSQDLEWRPQPRPLEDITGVDTYYGVADLADGTRLRTLISRPEGTRGPLPALLFVQWVSCGSLEYRPGSLSREILARLARDAGRTLVRVERAASGDSLGPDCDALDYDTELAHYAEAFVQLMDSPHVASHDLVIVGSSLGSTLAPLLAEILLEAGFGVKGVTVQGGGGHTYLERMIQFDRQYLERRADADPMVRHDEMIDRIRFHYEYLVRGRSPDEIAADDDRMASVRRDIRGLGDGHHYGRPYRWHQQAAAHNVLAAWARLPVQVLVVFNAFDQFEGRHGHHLIVDTVNRLRPGTAEFREFDQTGHSNLVYPDVIRAYRGEGGDPAPNLLSGVILDWLSRRLPVAAS